MSESDVLCPKCGRPPRRMAVGTFVLGSTKPAETDELVMCPRCNLTFCDGRWVDVFGELKRTDRIHRAQQN